MIGKALQFTSDAIDQFLRNQFSLDERKVELNRLVDPDGSVPTLNQNKLVISLINIDKETLQPLNVRSEKLPNGKYADFSMGIRFNLYVMLSANFDNYSEGLKFLNAGILFFQVHSFLDRRHYADMPANLGKLEFEIEKMSYVQMHNLWTSMGAKYQPSAIYKMKLITVRGSDISGFTPAVMEVSKEYSSQ